MRVLTLGELMPAAPPPPEDGLLHLRTETPLWLRGDEELCRALCPGVPWLALLARAGIRRLDVLVRAFAPPVDGRLPRAELPDLVTVELIRGAFTPWSSSCFSHRQRQRMPLEGLQGDAVVHGTNLAALAPLLRALTVTSVGKSTSLGLGTLRVVTPMSAAGDPAGVEVPAAPPAGDDARDPVQLVLLLDNPLRSQTHPGRPICPRRTARPPRHRAPRPVDRLDPAATDTQRCSALDPDPGPRTW